LSLLPSRPTILVWFLGLSFFIRLILAPIQKLAQTFPGE
jgi:hypothetical protein